MTLDFINVGYGDAILIRSGSFTMLVDCGDWTVGDGGPDSQRISAADFLRQEGIDTLDLLVLTHLHRDHSGGLAKLLECVAVRSFRCNYLPDRIFWGKRVPVPEEFSAGARCLLESLNVFLSALAIMEQQGTEVSLASPGTWPLTPELTAECFLEAQPIFERQAAIWQNVLEDRADNRELEELDGFINNTSIRLRLSYAGQEIELPGDVYASCWERHQLPPCTLIKLPHHGHGDALTSRLLEMLRPRYAVISVSDDRTDDCPSKKIIQLLSQFGVECFFTDAVPCQYAPDQPHVAIRFRIEKGVLMVSDV